ncbi:unnamed protein product [Calypogeia fissa]
MEGCAGRKAATSFLSEGGVPIRVNLWPDCSPVGSSIHKREIRGTFDQRVSGNCARRGCCLASLSGGFLLRNIIV